MVKKMCQNLHNSSLFFHKAFWPNKIDPFVTSINSYKRISSKLEYWENNTSSLDQLYLLSPTCVEDIRIQQQKGNAWKCKKIHTNSFKTRHEIWWRVNSFVRAFVKLFGLKLNSFKNASGNLVVEASLQCTLPATCVRNLGKSPFTRVLHHRQSKPSKLRDHRGKDRGILAIFSHLQGFND